MSMIVVDKNLKSLLPLANRHYIVEKGRIVWSGDSASNSIATSGVIKSLTIGSICMRIAHVRSFSFGLVGLFIGPVLLAVSLAIWREWLEEHQQKAQVSSASSSSG